MSIILIQAYSPPPKYDAFFPNASHWAELRRPFRAFTAISLQRSAGQQFNNSTPEEHPRAESPDYFSPIPKGWGIDIQTLFAGLKA